jgi:oligopeptide transport system permease protein
MTGAAEPIELRAKELVDHGRGFWGDAFARLLHNPAAIVGGLIVLFLVLVSIIGPYVIPWDYRVQDLEAVVANNGRPLPPLSPEHLLGTDRLGRDLLSRTIDGTQVSMSVALASQLVVILIGLPIGALAGWFGGRVDTLLMRFTDVFYAFPEILFIIIVTTAFISTPFGKVLNGLLLVMLAISLSAWVTMARLMRAQVLSLRNREFVEAARAMGVSDFRIITRHVLPNAIGPIVVAVSLGIPAAILAESTLSFLGIGIQMPRASWGSLIDDGTELMARAPWLVIPPVVALVVTVIGFTLLGDAARDAFEPRNSERK